MHASKHAIDDSFPCCVSPTKPKSKAFAGRLSVFAGSPISGVATFQA